MVFDQVRTHSLYIISHDNYLREVDFHDEKSLVGKLG